MRLNKYLALHTGISRRSADEAVRQNRVRVNGELPENGYDVKNDDIVMLDEKVVKTDSPMTTIMINKPPGYVCSRDGQGSETVYDLLPKDLNYLKPVGRLDKQSSGLLLLTNDGQLAFELTHPSKQKTKVYEVTLNKALQPLHQQMISDFGVTLSDGQSKFLIQKENDTLIVTMREGRNRQIRRTFDSLGYFVETLHRTHFGSFSLNGLGSGKYKKLD